MALYVALVDQTPHVVGVIFPDCPGCYAAGDTFEEAIANAGKALDEWLTDRLDGGFAAPSPRSVAQLRADPSLAEDFAECALVALVRAGLDEVQPGLHLDGDLMAAVNAAAARRGITVEAFLAAAARERLAADR